MQKSNHEKQLTILLGFAFFLSQLATLTRFPFMHSDESWLSGLTRFMMENRSLAVTEPFFDLYPRNPHAIKSTYHILQALFIQVLGYDLFSVRLMSLLFGSLSVILFAWILKSFRITPLWIILGSLLLAAQPVYQYGAHFARQEIVVVFFLLLIAFSWSKKKRILSLVSAFFAMGLHPNAFLGGTALVLTGLFTLWKSPKERQQLLKALPWLAGFTLFYIMASLWMNPNFFSDYLAYGASLGVTASAGGKFTGFFFFFKKLWLGISGTYYLPPLRFSLIVIATGFLAGGIIGFIKRDRTLLGLQIHQAAWALGILIVGRYNATSILYFVPGAVITLVLIAARYANRLPVKLASVGMILWFSLLSYGEITALPPNHYPAYLESIEQIVPEDAVVLANLNAEFAFKAGRLYDYRNLAHLDQAGLSVDQYIRDRQISYILYADELDYLHRNPDPWQVLYGPDQAWYEEMQTFLSSQCEEIADLQAPIYGNRIVSFLNDPYWHLHIYRVKP